MGRGQERIVLAFGASLSHVFLGSSRRAAFHNLGLNWCAFGQTLLATDNDERYRPRGGWARWPLRLPDQIATGFVRLLRPHGEFAEIRLPEDDRAAARRGYAALALSVAPDTYVADVDPERNVLVVHRIGARPSAMEREVTR